MPRPCPSTSQRGMCSGRRFLRVRSALFPRAVLVDDASHRLHGVSCSTRAVLSVALDGASSRRQEEFHLSHEFLAMMLGSTRPTVTAVAGTLKGGTDRIR